MTTCVYQDGVLYTDTKATIIPHSEEMMAQVCAIMDDENHPLFNHMTICYRHRWTGSEKTGKIEDGKFLDCQSLDIRTRDGEKVIAAAIAGGMGNVPFLEHFLREGQSLPDALESALDMLADIIGHENRQHMSLHVIAVTEEAVYYYCLFGSYVYSERRYEKDQTIMIGSGAIAHAGVSQAHVALMGYDNSDLRDRYAVTERIGDIQSFYNGIAKKDPMTNNDVKYIVC